MQKMKNIHRPEVEIWASKVAKSGKMRGLQDRHLRMRHPLIRVHANLVPRANVSFGQRQDTELWNNQSSKLGWLANWFVKLLMRKLPSVK